MYKLTDGSISIINWRYALSNDKFSLNEKKNESISIHGSMFSHKLKWNLRNERICIGNDNQYWIVVATSVRHHE